MTHGQRDVVPELQRALREAARRTSRRQPAPEAGACGSPTPELPCPGRRVEGYLPDMEPTTGLRPSASVREPLGESCGWRAPLALWLGSRVAVALAAFAGMYVVQVRDDRGWKGFLASWTRWDVDLFRKVAEFGYLQPQTEHLAVDFPALPLLLRAVHAFWPDWTAAGLLISFLSGACACIALCQLAAQESGAEAGRRAVLYLVLFPYAVFLFAGYSEALFLGFAVPAWLAAQRDRWRLACLLGAGAAATRITGLPFAAALAVEYLVTRRRAPRPNAEASNGDRKSPVGGSAAWLLLPAVPVLAYVGYLRVRSGRWDAYLVAQREGWGRRLASPIEGWTTTWSAAQDASSAPPYQWFWYAELTAVVLGVVLVIVLASGRRWGEFTFVGLNLLIMSATTYYASGARAVLVWFPLYLLLARVSLRQQWVHWAVMWCSTPLMFVFVLAFTNGVWVD